MLNFKKKNCKKLKPTIAISCRLMLLLLLYVQRLLLPLWQLLAEKKTRKHRAYITHNKFSLCTIMPFWPVVCMCLSLRPSFGLSIHLSVSVGAVSWLVMVLILFCFCVFFFFVILFFFLFSFSIFWHDL